MPQRGWGSARPALSNLLNSNSSLSSDMAVRFAKAFGADRQKLLELQSSFDNYKRRGEEKDRCGPCVCSEFPNHQGPANPKLGKEQYRSPPSATGTSAQAGAFDRP